MEKWKVCKQCNKYEVSNIGNVRNRKSKRLLARNIGKQGYARVNLAYKKNKYKTYYIRDLIAINFIGPCRNRSISNKDGNIANDRVENLYYTKMKRKTGWTKKLRGNDANGKTNTSKLTADDVCKIRNSRFDTQASIAKDFKICQPYVSRIKAKLEREKVICCSGSK